MMKEKMQVVGIQRLQGKSKAGNEYDFTNLKVLNAVQDDDRSTGSGFDVKDINVHPEKVQILLNKAKEFKFPVILDVTLETVKNDYGNFVAVATDLG
jgi:hypothetical protein